MAADQHRELSLLAAHADVGFAVGDPNGGVDVCALLSACGKSKKSFSDRAKLCVFLTFSQQVFDTFVNVRHPFLLLCARRGVHRE
jgi:hypothetical protein